MRCNLLLIAIVAMIVLTLSACAAQTETPYAAEMLLNTPAQQSGVLCEVCDQATRSALLTQEQNSVDNQAAATAAIVRANAQATLNSANATLNAAQTQAQSNANYIAAQIAATAEMERANAQATLNSAGATQNAALTQDAIQQTQRANLATANAQALAIQQSNDRLAASTQTAVANGIATQTQAAVATSQWYSDQERQREEQRQGPVTFLWMWCFPIFVLLFAGLILFGFWRWLKNQQANQLILENPVERLPAQTIEVFPHQHDGALPQLESDVIDTSFQPVKTDDQMRRWLDEVKRKLLKSDKEDEENETDN